MWLYPRNAITILPSEKLQISLMWKGEISSIAYWTEVNTLATRVISIPLTRHELFSLKNTLNSKINTKLSEQNNTTKRLLQRKRSQCTGDITVNG